jgi:uncharacterized membrane protein YqhA
MKSLFYLLSFVVKFIAFFVFASGIVLTALGAFDFFHSFSHVNSERAMLGLLAVGLLHSIDLFLMAIVFFVFSLGILVLFDNPGNETIRLPEWLRISNFTQLKVILWEAILTTLVVSFIAGLVEKRLDGQQLGIHNLIIPGSILLLAISLHFLKKKEGDPHG